MTSNQIAYWQLQETKRTNQAREAETHRSNRATEGLTARRDTATRRYQEQQIELGKQQNKIGTANAVANMFKGVGSWLPW